MIRCILPFIFSGIFCWGAYAHPVKRVIECRDPRGVSFDASTPERSWEAESGSVFEIVFIDKQGSYDVVVRDKIGESIIPASSSGYAVFVDDEEHLTIVISTAPLKTLEIFQLSYTQIGSWQLVYSIFKNGAPPREITSAKSYAFKCRNI